MKDLAYFDKNIEIYWHGIVVCLGLLLGVLLTSYLISRLRSGAFFFTAWLFAASFLPAILLSRAYFCFFAVKDNFFAFNGGGYGLYGAVLAVAAVAAIAGKIDRVLTPAALLDCVAPAGLLAIAVGRFASGLSGEELGDPVVPAFARAPFAVQSSTDGLWYLAVFVLEGAVALIICAVSIMVFMKCYRNRRAIRKPGTVAIFSSALYTSTQCVLESMRSDPLFLKPFNLGFVKASQVVSAIILIVLLVILFVRAWKAWPGAAQKLQIAAWVLAAAAFTFGFILEFRLNSGVKIQNYSLMSVCMLFAGVLGAVMASKLGAAWKSPALRSRAPAAVPPSRRPADQPVPRRNHPRGFGWDDEFGAEPQAARPQPAPAQRAQPSFAPRSQRGFDWDDEFGAEPQAARPQPAPAQRPQPSFAPRSQQPSGQNPRQTHPGADTNEKRGGLFDKYL